MNKVIALIFGLAFLNNAGAQEIRKNDNPVCDHIIKALKDPKAAENSARADVLLINLRDPVPGSLKVAEEKQDEKKAGFNKSRP